MEKILGELPGSIMELKPGESFEPFPPHQISRDYVTPERKAYYFMIDTAIKTGWAQYCEAWEHDQQLPSGWAVMFQAWFPTIPEQITRELARGYAQKHNIMPDIAWYVYDPLLEYEAMLARVHAGFISKDQAEREFKKSPLFDSRIKTD